MVLLEIVATNKYSHNETRCMSELLRLFLPPIFSGLFQVWTLKPKKRSGSNYRVWWGFLCYVFVIVKNKLQIQTKNRQTCNKVIQKLYFSAIEIIDNLCLCLFFFSFSFSPRFISSLKSIHMGFHLCIQSVVVHRATGNLNSCWTWTFLWNLYRIH